MVCKVATRTEMYMKGKPVETMLDLLPLPDVERLVLTSSPLVLALCQVQFTTVLSIADTAAVSAFHNKIRDKYPIANLTARVEVGVGETNIRQTQSTQWQFSDLDSIWQVVLAPASISLETRKYTEFSEFLDRLGALLTSVIEHFQPPIGTRIGLRYINELRSTTMSWSDAISRTVLGPLGVSALSENAEQLSGVQQILLRYPGNQGITIHQGVLPGGTTVRQRPGEQVPDGQFYLLDFDVFREFPMPVGLLMEPKSICKYVEEYHQVIYRLFRWSVTDGYLSSVRGA